MVKELRKEGIIIGSGNIGERYILNELLRRGVVHAYLANSSTQNGWDIAIFKEIGTDNIFNIKKIQVNTLNWKSEKSKVLTGNFGISSDFDYLAMVILNYSAEEPYIHYVIPKTKLKINTERYKLVNIDDAGDKTVQYTNSTLTLNKLDICRKFLKEISEEAWADILN